MVNSPETSPLAIDIDARGIVFYCRSGYEKDASDEIAALSANYQWFGYANFKTNQGYFTFNFYDNSHALAFANQINIDSLVFSRQYFVRYAILDNLPPKDRLGAVINGLEKINQSGSVEAKSFLCLGSVSVDYPDTESGKQLARFAKKFVVPLRQSLRRSNQMSEKEDLLRPMLHLYMTDFSQWFIGLSLEQSRSPYHNGIHRLKFPSDAPSRSTLKLEEALIDLVPQSSRTAFLREGARAVDLGACPGGWTYQLVKHKVYVDAVDNGAMADSLMQTGLVNYAAADGFKYRPEYGIVDLVVCDMIERPDRVAQLITEWLLKPFARAAIFNLKLPMKMRFETVNGLLKKMDLQLQQSNDMSFIIRCKHLYHNRDEVTVSVLPVEKSYD
jgi:23S rRNA (cytidine2498-2'-O)-methyltransferase